MPPHAIGSATVSFGLVSIPIKIYSATQSSDDISFHLLHKKCSTRLKQQYICPTDNEVVAREDMVKGYEFSKDRYVIFTPEELKAMEEKSTQSVEITEFVSLDKVDPVYFDKAYYLSPDKGGDKPYVLLAETMRRTHRAALARYGARGKQYLVLVRAVADGLVMQTLHYADEIRAIAEVPTAAATVHDKELQLAAQLVDQITAKDFHPENYHDEVKQRWREAIQKKVDGEEVQIAPAVEPRAQIIDLMEALKASLNAAPAKAGELERKAPKRAPRAAPAKRVAKEK